MKMYFARVIVDPFTDKGDYCLSEIKGLNHGTILNGVYTPANGAFLFKWNGQDAVLWTEINARLLRLETIEYGLEDMEKPYLYELYDYYDFESEDEARSVRKRHGGTLVYGCGLTNMETNEYDVTPFWRKSLKEARKALRDYLK